MSTDSSDNKKTPTEIDREIGRRIKTRRNQLGMNQQMLAERIGVSYQQVQKYENGTDRVGASRLYMIAKALNSDISEFYESDQGHLREPGAPYDAGIDAQRIMATEEGRALVRAFLSIEDQGVRQKLMELADALVAVRRPRRGRPPNS